MKKYLNINKTLLFTVTITIIFILINYFAINKKITLLLTTCLYMSTLIIYFFITQKEYINLYLKDIKLEIKNIHWPEKKEINQTTLMVLIIVLSTSIILWIIDSLLTYIVSKII